MPFPVGMVGVAAAIADGIAFGTANGVNCECGGGATVSASFGSISMSSPPVLMYHLFVPTESMWPAAFCTSGTLVAGHESESRVNPSSSFCATLSRCVSELSSAREPPPVEGAWAEYGVV
jgi:hypothetical protein